MILANLTLTIEILKVQLPFDLFLKNQDIYDLITLCEISIFGKLFQNFKLQIFAKKVFNKSYYNRSLLLVHFNDKNTFCWENL